MAGHRTHHNPLEQDTLFTTPASFMLDARLTPLERNGWQVPRSAEGKSVGKPGEVASLSHLNPAGTAGRVRDDLACSRRASAYRVDQSGGAAPRSSERPCAQRAVSGSRKRACPLDACLPALLQSSIGHENNLVDRVAVHIQAKQVQAPEAACIATHGQRRDDDDLPLHRRIRPDPCSSHDPG